MPTRRRKPSAAALTRRLEASAALEAMGAERLKKEDRFGDTKSGWWLDTVYLGPAHDPEHALALVRGGG